MTARSKGMIILPLAGILALLAVMHWCGTEQFPEQGDGPTATVSRGLLQFKLVEEGRLVANRSETYASEIDDRRVRISYLIPEGSLVEEGDPLIRFDAADILSETEQLETQSRELESEVEKIRGDLEILGLEKKRRLDEQRDEIRLAELALTNLVQGSSPLKIREFEAARDAAERRLEQLRSEYEDLKPLLDKGYITAGEMERVAAGVASAEAELEIAEIKLHTYREYSLPEEIEKAELRLKSLKKDLNSISESDSVKEQRLGERLIRVEQSLGQTRAKIEKLERYIDAAEVTARSPGIVIYQKISDPLTGARRVQVGDQVFGTQPLITLPDVSAMNVEFRVRETDIHRLEVGQPVGLFVRAYPGLMLEGLISLIGTLARDDGFETEEKYFQVTARITDGDRRLRPGMTVRVEITVAKAEDALHVPVSAVFHRQGRSICFVETRPGRWETRNVETGLLGNDRVQILAGLQEEETVSLAIPAGS